MILQWVMKLFPMISAMMDLTWSSSRMVEKCLSQVAVSQPRPLVNNFDGPQDTQPGRPSQKHAQPPRRNTDAGALPVQAPSSPAFDEFDEDDDTFTTELENLAAKVDSQDKGALIEEVHTIETKLPTPMPVIDELDGVFEDDDDLLMQIADDVDHGKPGFGSTSQVRPYV